jgi:hypothetical protein
MPPRLALYTICPPPSDRRPAIALGSHGKPLALPRRASARVVLLQSTVGYRVNQKLSLDTGAPLPPHRCHATSVSSCRHDLARLTPHDPGALAAATAASRHPAHRWQSRHRARQCTVTATPTRVVLRVTVRPATVAARLGHTSRLARHMEQATPAGGSSLWAGFGSAAGDPFSFYLF